MVEKRNHEQMENSDDSQTEEVQDVEVKQEITEAFPPKITKAIIEENDGKVEFCVVLNDSTDQSMILLSGLRSIFQKQLPNMPKEYIARLVFDKSHCAMAVVRRPYTVLGGITYKPFINGGFAEIVFCAIDTTCQVQGYGSRLMSHVKDHVKVAHGTKHFLTYADNYAIGYFKKQGFTTDITLEKSLWMGYIKDYEGGTIMQAVFKKIRDHTMAHIVHKNNLFDNGEESLDPSKIPGLREAGWMPNASHLSYRPTPRQRSPLYIFMKKLLDELHENTHSWPFVEPVAGVPDYYDIIKSPMDLRTLNDNIEANKYNTLDEFTADVNLIWNNCRTYNQDGSTYVKWYAHY
ncbi:histone acetyltransferase [Terramyces sp. JEL0728]|nr:histone acetyltransferase [Terramyces sp. JEL0728]